MTPSDEPEWRALNRANWDERVGVHLGPRGYTLRDLRAGQGALNVIEEAELGPVAGLRVLHLQCHFGRDSLCLAQRGANVTGLDFSALAIAAARELTAELGLTASARFVLSDIYAARTAIPEPAAFDLVYITWGTICWLPDIAEWARIIAHFLKPGGALYFAEAHPTALVFDDRATGADGRPGWFAPYFHPGVLEIDEERDYMDLEARFTNKRTHQFMHPIGAVITALLQAGLTPEWLHEHKESTWRMFACQAKGKDGLYRWPDQPWFPLAYSLRARKI